MRHEDYKHLLALEAVGALEEGERARLEEHLPGCAECREELREMADAAASLVYTVAPTRPSPGLRANILQRVRAVDPSEVFVDPSEVAAAPTSAVDPSEARGRGGRLRGDGPNARALLGGFSLWQLLTGRPALGFGAAAAALALVVLGATTLTLWGRNQTLSAEVARLYDRVRSTESELAGQREQLAGARVVNDLLASPGVRVAEMAGKEPAPGARAMLAYDRSTGRAVIMASGLPPCPEGHAYQLWLIAGKTPLPGGTFKADSEGRAQMTDRLPPDVGLPTFAVTLEREGGVSAPEGSVYLVGASKG